MIRRKKEYKMRMGTAELLVVLAVVMIIFGPTQFPRLARIAGHGVKNLRRAARKTVLTDEDTESGKTVS